MYLNIKYLQWYFCYKMISYNDFGRFVKTLNGDIKNTNI